MLNTDQYKALDLAQPTDFRSMLRSGELLWGTSCRIASEEAARIVATLPHHFCFIDSVIAHSILQDTRVESDCRPGAFSAECHVTSQLNQDHSTILKRAHGSICAHRTQLIGPH